MRANLTLTAVAVLASLTGALQAATYAVDPVKGNDSNPGTSKQPWKTMAPVNKLELKGGDKLLVKPGTIVGSLAPQVKGSKEKPVVIKFAPGNYQWQAEGLNEEKLHISNTNDAPDMPKRVMIDLHGAKHLVITGDDAILFCCGRMMEIHMDQCKDITFKDIAIDYARPTISEYTALEVGDKEAVFQIHPDSKYVIENGKLSWVGDGWKEGPGCFVQEFTAEPLHVSNVGGNKGLSGQVEEIEPGKVRMSYDKNPGFRKGSTYQHRQIRREYASVFCNNSSNISYLGVKFHFMHGMGVVSQFSKNLTFDNVTIAPREGSGRTCASWADMLHFSGCYGKISVNNVLFHGANDDAINIHGTHLKITEMKDPRHITVRFCHGQTWGFEGFRKGDEVDVISGKNLNSKGMNKVVSATMSQDKRGMELELEKDLPADVAVNEDCLENVTATPEVVVTNCRVECIPTRAFLLTTRKPITIKDNVFVRSHMSAILVADDARSWYESGFVRKLTIEGNTFDHCGGPVINVAPENREHAQAVHSGISILNNKFLMDNKNGVSLKSTSNVLIEGNSFSNGTAQENVRQNNCTDVTVK